MERSFLFSEFIYNFAYPLIESSCFLCNTKTNGFFDMVNLEYFK